jgi:L-arabinose isomerase
LDAFQEHLATVYETPTFYGDETLKRLLDHAQEVVKHLNKYEEVYSFTQPDLLEQLAAATEELEKEYDQEETSQKEEQ